MKDIYDNVSLEKLCKLVDKSRQAYYKVQRKRVKRAFNIGIIIELVNRERIVAKRIGSKKLHLILNEELIDNEIKIGRDRFHAVLRDNSLIIQKIRRGPHTTNSKHTMKKYPNLAANLKIDRAEQLWVSDITYLRSTSGFYYLMLITDSYSRKIVGYNVGEKMTAIFCEEALDDAIKNRSFKDRNLIHHSDRGTQYCSQVYTQTLIENDIKISMTENGDPLENPLAERMNRTLKDTFALDVIFDLLEDAKRIIDLAINYYNNRLPHSSLNMMVPSKAHSMIGYISKQWKSYWKESLATEYQGDSYTPQWPS